VLTLGVSLVRDGVSVFEESAVEDRGFDMPIWISPESRTAAKLGTEWKCKHGADVVAL
jgi:hypothetical protein